MRITDNLIKDIANAPEWFFEAIKVEPKNAKLKIQKEISLIQNGIVIQKVKTCLYLSMELEHIKNGGIQ